MFFGLYDIQYHIAVEIVSLTGSYFPREASGFDYSSISNSVRHPAEQHSSSVFGWTSVSVSAWACNTVVFLLTKAFTIMKLNVTCLVICLFTLAKQV